ncbi:hypothetical protein MKX03_030655 [Papaver bracteatum]|nr:hypothetical protein MKX03_030655 [Papaver bracteatum]
MNKQGKSMKLKQEKKKIQKQHKKKPDLAACCQVLVCETSAVLPDVPQVIVYEIMSRLPVKSLMRFKCVCKNWQSVILKDDLFIDLHLSRSKAASSVSLLRVGELKNIEYCFISMELLLSSEEDGHLAAVGATSAWKYPFPIDKMCSFCTANGLLCVMDIVEYSVCVYNISTRESTPWIKSTFIKQRQEEDKKQELHKDFFLNKFGFGYDPVTKEHKVIALWKYYALDGLGTTTYELGCEVLTVIDNTWRRIDAIVPPLRGNCSYFDYAGESVHASGFIYWLHSHYPCEEPCIIQFDVSSEKFKKMKILLPKPIIHDKLHFSLSLSLIDIDGRLGLFALGKTSTKMYIYYEQDKESKTDTSTTSSAASNPTCNYYWMEDTFSVPPFDCRPRWSHRYRHIPGTDLFVVRCKDDNKSFDYYNWKKNSYGSCKIPLGIISSFGYIQDVIFTPNLFPVN